MVRLEYFVPISEAGWVTKPGAGLLTPFQKTAQHQY